MINKISTIDGEKMLLFKVLLCGNSSTGKTSLIKKYIDNKINENTISTIGVDYNSKIFKIKEKLIKIMIWDTAGQERFRSIISCYFKGAHGIILVFDISSKKMGSLQMSFIKNLIGVIGFFFTIIFLKIPNPHFSNLEIILLLLSGLIGVGIADLMFLSSLKRLGSGFSAIISTIYSPSIFLFSFLMFSESIGPKSYIGGILVILGIAVSTFELPKTKDKKTIIYGVLLGVCAQIFTAFSVLLVKPIMLENSIIFVALYRFSIGLLFTFFFLKYRLNKPNNENLSKIIIKAFKNKYIILGSFMGTYLSVILWLAGFKYTLSGRAAIYNQLSTILIILFAYFILKDPISKKNGLE